LEQLLLLLLLMMMLLLMLLLLLLLRWFRRKATWPLRHFGIITVQPLYRTCNSRRERTR
jgi:hypothetical protein